jgi:methionyl-tRNA formyltransferase
VHGGWLYDVGRLEPGQRYDTGPVSVPDPTGGDRLAAAVAAGTKPEEIGVPQDATRATRAPRLAKQDGVIDWSQPAARIERQRRALEPWPRAATFFTRGDGVRQRLVLADAEVAADPRAAAAPSGEVLDTAGGRIVVACGAGTALAITQVVPEGRRSMSAADFLRGSPLLPGMRLG